MDYRKSAQGVLEQIGGKENIISAAHCATRLRLVISDNNKVNKEALENVDGVQGVFEAAGQLQIIFGTGIVNKVYAEFINLAGITGASKDEVKQAAAAKQNIAKRAIKTLGDIFVPIIPAIVASGLLMGLLEGLCNVWPQMASSGSYTIVHLFSNAAFVFLPILIAISAAKTFGGNLFLGAVIGMIMIHTDLLNAWAVAGADSIPTAKAWFGLYTINLTGYQGHVIPVIIAVWLMSVIEKKLHKIVPAIIDLFVTPLVTVLVTGYVTLTVIGPIFATLETWVLNGAKDLIMLPMGIGGGIIGLFYAPTVVAGVHHMYNAIEAGLLAQDGGVNIWMPIATAANCAQGAAALAVALKTRNAKKKAMAFPASLSAFLGITEPALFGVNIRYIKAFIAGCIGGCAGGIVAGALNVGASAYGITGVFGFLITTANTAQYALVMAVAIGVAFVLSWIMYRDEPAAGVVGGKSEQLNANVEPGEVLVPVTGKVIPLNETPDETFASGVMGQGAAIDPNEGKVYAPVNGVATTVFPTGHAIGITTDDGAELLIHIGLNTVELNGKNFTTHVTEGESVKAGQLLVTFDKDEIVKAGYSVITPVVVTNSADYASVEIVRTGVVDKMEKMLKISK